MLKTRLTDMLDLRYPIISAPMARMSGSRLAAAVSAAGAEGAWVGTAFVATHGNELPDPYKGPARLGQVNTVPHLMPPRP